MAQRQSPHPGPRWKKEETEAPRGGSATGAPACPLPPSPLGLSTLPTTQPSLTEKLSGKNTHTQNSGFSPKPLISSNCVVSAHRQLKLRGNGGRQVPKPGDLVPAAHACTDLSRGCRQQPWPHRGPAMAWRAWPGSRPVRLPPGSFRGPAASLMHKRVTAPPRAWPISGLSNSGPVRKGSTAGLAGSSQLWPPGQTPVARLCLMLGHNHGVKRTGGQELTCCLSP